MKGTYKVYQNGELISVSSNLITDQGKRHILRYLAGEEPAIGGAIAVGVGTGDPVGSNFRLTYELVRSTIYLISPDYITNNLIFKTTINQNVVGNIYEIGMFSTEFGAGVAGSPNRALASFERDYESWSAGSFFSNNTRLGYESLRLSPAANGTASSNLPSVGMDLSAYANSDIIAVAFHCGNSNTSSVRVRFRGVDPSNYFERVITSPMAGYNVRSWTKSDTTKVGIVDWTNIDSIEVSVSSTSGGSAQVDFDGIRIESFGQDISNVLVSRSLLSSPVRKTDVGDMDIEYWLEVNI